MLSSWIMNIQELNLQINIKYYEEKFIKDLERSVLSRTEIFLYGFSIETR